MSPISPQRAACQPVQWKGLTWAFHTDSGLEMICLDQPIYSGLHCQITVILNTLKAKRFSPDKVHFKHFKTTSVIRTTTRHGVRWCNLMVSDSHYRLCITFYNNLRLYIFVKWPDKNGIFCCAGYQKAEWMFHFMSSENITFCYKSRKKGGVNIFTILISVTSHSQINIQ